MLRRGYSRHKHLSLLLVHDSSVEIVRGANDAPLRMRVWVVGLIEHGQTGALMRRRWSD
jgi:hypothetical protein